MRRTASLVVLMLLCLLGTANAQTSLSSTTCPGAGCTIVALDGAGTVGVQIEGTFSGTIVFEYANNDAVWRSLTLYVPGTTTGVTSTTAPGFWTGSIAGMKRARVRFSVYTSGTASVHAQVSAASANWLVNGLFGTARTSTSVYSNSTVATIAWDPVVSAGKAVTASTGFPTAGFFFSSWNPTALRTDRSIGFSNNTRIESGSFGASIRGFFNEVDVLTTGTTTSVQGFTNDIVTHGGPATHPDITGILSRIFAQGSGNITTAVGVESHVENDGPTVGTGIAFYGDINNYGSSFTQAIAYYAGPSNLAYAAKASFYAEAGAGQAEFDDGTLTPIVSHNASSVLSITSNTIAPTNGVHHLGAGLVKTITKPTTCSVTCSIAIVPDAAFTTDATGNISLASLAVINKVIIFVWDGTKWNPSY